MAIYCQFLPLKNGEGTPNEKAAELFGSARDYCEKNTCPYNGEIDDMSKDKKFKHIVGGFIPLKCYKSMPEKIRKIFG